MMITGIRVLGNNPCLVRITTDEGHFCLLGVLVSYVDRPSPEEIRRRVAFFQRVGAPWVGAKDFASQARRSNRTS